MDVRNAVYPGSAQIAEFFGAPEDGPFVMVNLLKFKDKAEYADGADADISGREAYQRYGVEVSKLVVALGAHSTDRGRSFHAMVGGASRRSRAV